MIGGKRHALGAVLARDDVDRRLHAREHLVECRAAAEDTGHAARAEQLLVHQQAQEVRFRTYVVHRASSCRKPSVEVVLHQVPLCTKQQGRVRVLNAVVVDHQRGGVRVAQLAAEAPLRVVLVGRDAADAERLGHDLDHQRRTR